MTIACFAQSSRRPSPTVDVYGDPLHRSAISPRPLDRVKTHSTVCPCTTVHLTGTIVVFSFRMHVWKRRLGTTLSAYRSGCGRGVDCTALEGRTSSRSSRLGRGNLLINVQDVIRQFDLQSAYASDGRVPLACRYDSSWAEDALGCLICGTVVRRWARRKR